MLTSVLRSLTRSTVTTLLDLVGLGLLVAASAVRFGAAAALAVSGGAVLAVSWSLSRPQK